MMPMSDMAMDCMKMGNMDMKNIDMNLRPADLNFEKLFNWLDHYKLDNIYFAHANPFEYGNWLYLNSNEKYIEAAHSLYGKQKPIGIFGHTHRRNISLISNNNIDFVEFNYDLNKHKESIRRASFSKETQKKIFSFF